MGAPRKPLKLSELLGRVRGEAHLHPPARIIRLIAQDLDGLRQAVRAELALASFLSGASGRVKPHSRGTKKSTRWVGKTMALGVWL